MAPYLRAAVAGGDGGGTRWALEGLVEDVVPTVHPIVEHPIRVPVRARGVPDVVLRCARAIQRPALLVPRLRICRQSSQWLLFPLDCAIAAASTVPLARHCPANWVARAVRRPGRGALRCGVWCCWPPAYLLAAACALPSPRSGRGTVLRAQLRGPCHRAARGVACPAGASAPATCAQRWGLGHALALTRTRRSTVLHARAHLPGTSSFQCDDAPTPLAVPSTSHSALKRGRAILRRVRHVQPDDAPLPLAGAQHQPLRPEEGQGHECPTACCRGNAPTSNTSGW